MPGTVTRTVRILLEMEDRASGVVGTTATSLRGARTEAGGLGAAGTSAFGQVASGAKMALSGITTIITYAGYASAAITAIGAAGLYAGKKLVDASEEERNAFLGLSTVAAKYKISTEDAKKAALDFASDGLMTVGESADFLKTMLQRFGTMGLDPTIKLMYAMSDVAAFNRQGMLGFGQALIGGAQGLKNLMSQMVDNMGITKNISIIMKEAGFSMEDLDDETKRGAAIQALWNGIMKEAAIFQGDRAKMADTFTGAEARLGAQTKLLASDIGDMLKPAYQDLYNAGTDVVENIRDWVNNGENQKAVQADVNKTIATASDVIGGYAKSVKAYLLDGEVFLEHISTVETVTHIALGTLAAMGFVIAGLAVAFLAADYGLAAFGHRLGLVSDEGLAKSKEDLRVVKDLMMDISEYGQGQMAKAQGGGAWAQGIETWRGRAREAIGAPEQASDWVVRQQIRRMITAMEEEIRSATAGATAGVHAPGVGEKTPARMEIEIKGDAIKVESRVHATAGVREIQDALQPVVDGVYGALTERDQQIAALIHNMAEEAALAALGVA